MGGIPIRTIVKQKTLRVVRSVITCGYLLPTAAVGMYVAVTNVLLGRYQRGPTKCLYNTTN